MSKILGVRLDDITPKTALEKVLEFSRDSKSHYVVTPNPELVVAAQKDEEYKKALNDADLSLADGFGLIIAGKLNGQKLIRVTGSDLTKELLKVLAKSSQKVILINWNAGLSTAAELETEIKMKYKGINFRVVDIPKAKVIPPNALEEINKYKPEVLFLSLGAPWQEFICNTQLMLIPSARVAICVGGSFEFILGKMKRAPKTFRKLGLEWLWRLAMQPKRIGRIWNAVVVFMSLVIVDAMKTEKKA